MSTELPATVEADQLTGTVRWSLTNAGNRPLRIRDVSQHEDLLVETPAGQDIYPAQFGWRFPREVVLEPGGRLAGQFDVLHRYLFPSAGTYRIFVKYDSTRWSDPHARLSRDRWPHQGIDPVTATSNVTFLNVPAFIIDGQNRLMQEARQRRSATRRPFT